MKDKTKKWLARAPVMVVSLAVSGLIAAYRGFRFGLPAYLNARYLSDGLFVGGFLLACFGALILVSTSTDFFDIFRYGFKSLLVLFTALKNPKDHPNYHEYKQQRAESRKKGNAFLLFAGLCLIGASVLCLLLYYSLPGA